MLIDNVIISGTIIDPKSSRYLKTENILPKLPDSHKELMFYVLIKHVNKDEKQIVACRFRKPDEYNKFIHAFSYNDHICLNGYLSDDENKEYYNYLEVITYRKVPANFPDNDIVFISGKGGNIINSPFRALITNNNINVDVFNDYSDNRKILKDTKGSIVGFLGISTGIGTYADNTVLINDGYGFNDSHFLSIYKHKKKEIKIALSFTSENDIFTNFNNICKCNHLIYSSSDLINFHVAMENKGLTILAGPSGVGKTELVKSYAESLGLLNPKREDKISPQYLHISVSPSWTDDTDLLGYYNVKQHRYYPSNTGLVELLYDASLHKDKLYIVLLDEMNLSHIEYYFSQFLSILELPKGDPNRRIRLYDNSYEKVSEDTDKSTSLKSFINYPSSIPIYDNVLFVGTINIDGSTKQITNKVLDRSNLIKINSYEFSSDLFKPRETKKLNNLLQNIIPITASKFKSFKNESKINSLASNNEISSSRRLLLTDLNKLLKLMTSSRREIGYREVKQIDEYLCDLPGENKSIVKDYMTKYHSNDEYKHYSDVAFDHQLSQRILDKLLGSKYELYGFISVLCDCMNGTNYFNSQRFSLNDNVLELLNPIKQEITNLLKNKIPHEYSGNLIKHKWLELHNYGFTR